MRRQLRTTGNGVVGHDDAQASIAVVLDNHFRAGVTVDRFRPRDGEIDDVPRPLAGEVRWPDLGADISTAVAAGRRIIRDVGHDRHIDDRNAAITLDDDVIFAWLADGLATHLPGYRAFDHRSATRPRPVEEAEVLGFGGIRPRRKSPYGETCEDNANAHNFTQHIYLPEFPRQSKSIVGLRGKTMTSYRDPPRKRC